MKLRTVLSELGVTGHLDGPGVDLEGDVFTYPSENYEASFEQLVVLAAEGQMCAPEGHLGLTLVFCGEALPDIKGRPDERVVLCSAEASFVEFRQRFGQLPERHVYLDLQRKRIYAAFSSSYDIQRYADKIHAILGNPLLIINSDHRMLASSGDFPLDRPDVREEVTQGYVLEEVDAELEAAGILDDVRHSGHSIISQNERFGQRWVTSIISYHHMEMGRFDMLEQDRPITETDLELVDFAGALAGVLIDKLGIAGKRAGSGSSVLDDILSNTLVNEKTMRAQLALSSMPLDDVYIIVSLAGERDIPRAHLQRIASHMTNAFRHSLWTTREGRLIIMVALGPRTTAGYDCYERAERILGQRKEFLTTLNRNGLTAYVSEPFEQLGLAPARFQQVEDLRAAGVEHEGRLVWFWEHRYAVIASLSQTFGQVDMMLDKRVVAVQLYDRDHGTAYLDTICRAVEFPGSPAEAARALNVHRNTYFYRMNKISELFFLDLRRGEDRLAVAFSTRVLASLGDDVLFDVDTMPDAWRRAVASERH